MSAMLLLRVVHTLVLVICIASLLPMGWFAVTGLGRSWAIWALLPPVGVFVGLLLNRGRCILQTLARRLERVPIDDPRWVRDILWLPEAWALRVVPVMLPVFVLVIGAALIRAIMPAQ